jgi:hypothetical protein
MKVWVLLSTDERMVLAVSSTRVGAWTAAENDAQEALLWDPSRHGGLVNDKWDYEIRPFEVIEDHPFDEVDG